MSRRRRDGEGRWGGGSKLVWGGVESKMEKGGVDKKGGGGKRRQVGRRGRRIKTMEEKGLK